MVYRSFAPREKIDRYRRVPGQRSGFRGHPIAPLHVRVRSVIDDRVADATVHGRVETENIGWALTARKQ